MDDVGRFISRIRNIQPCLCFPIPEDIAMTRQEKFVEEFKALLRKYDVEMTPIEGWCGYATTVDGVNFYSSSKFDSDGDLVKDQIDINFGRCEDGK